MAFEGVWECQISDEKNWIILKRKKLKIVVFLELLSGFTMTTVLSRYVEWLFCIHSRIIPVGQFSRKCANQSIKRRLSL